MEMLRGASFPWLPEGRSLFRDKRIPRENLNGLLVERTGIGAVLYKLTGMGGLWAQDPPYYAEVVDFHTGGEVDWSHTQLADWHGWQHDRWVYFYHNHGPIVVIDEAEGPGTRQAALIWHLKADVEAQGDAFMRLRRGSTEMHMLSWQADGLAFERVPDVTPDDASGDAAILATSASGELRAVTIFLIDHWVGAQTWIDWQEQSLYIAKADEVLAISLRGKTPQPMMH